MKTLYRYIFYVDMCFDLIRFSRFWWIWILHLFLPSKQSQAKLPIVFLQVLIFSIRTNEYFANSSKWPWTTANHHERDSPRCRESVRDLLEGIPRYLLRHIHRYHRRRHRFWWSQGNTNIRRSPVYLYRFENRHHFDTRPRPLNTVRPLFSPIQDDNGLKSSSVGQGHKGQGHYKCILDN